MQYVKEIVGLGPRPIGSANHKKVVEYILAHLKHDLVESDSFTITPPEGNFPVRNIIAKFPGTRDGVIIIASHYDTKRFREFRFVGANDGGSSTAFLLELARVLKGRKSPLTLELLFLDGEEAVLEWQGTDHTYGSRHYVEEAKRTHSLSSLKALVLIDMIGDRDLQLKRDHNSTVWMTDLFWDAARRQGLSTYFSSEMTQIEDDHLPFTEAGVPSVDIIDLDRIVHD